MNKGQIHYYSVLICVQLFYSVLKGLLMKIFITLGILRGFCYLFGCICTFLGFDNDKWIFLNSKNHGLNSKNHGLYL